MCACARMCVRTFVSRFHRSVCFCAGLSGNARHSVVVFRLHRLEQGNLSFGRLKESVVRGVRLRAVTGLVSVCWFGWGFRFGWGSVVPHCNLPVKPSGSVHSETSFFESRV